MKEIINELKERGFVDDLQRCVNVDAKLHNLNMEGQMYASKHVLLNYIEKLDEKDDLLNKFFDFAMDLAAYTIIKELDLKPDENYELSAKDKIASILALMKVIKEDK